MFPTEFALLPWRSCAASKHLVLRVFVGLDNGVLRRANLPISKVSIQNHCSACGQLFQDFIKLECHKRHRHNCIRKNCSLQYVWQFVLEFVQIKKPHDSKSERIIAAYVERYFKILSHWNATKALSYCTKCGKLFQFYLNLKSHYSTNNKQLQFMRKTVSQFG